MRRLVAVTAVFALAVAGLWAADKDSDDTPAAAATRKLLQTKITVNFKDTRLADVVEEIKEEHVKGIKIILDTKGGVSQNQAITYKGENVPLADALDAMFKKNGLGYVVISGKNNAYDGAVMIKQGKERGYPLKDKDEPAKDKEKPAKDK
jgi:autotransporter-associated beta strand protein